MIKDKDLKERTKQFALKIICLVASLPRIRESDIIGRQLLKAGTSVGANYRETIVQDRKRNLDRKSVLLNRNQMNHCIGWNC